MSKLWISEDDSYLTLLFFEQISIHAFFERERNSNLTDKLKLRLLLTLCIYLVGVLCRNTLLLEELKGTGGHDVEFFRLTMNSKRFKFSFVVYV